MRLFALLILYKDASEARLLKDAHDLSTFGFFQRSGVKEFIIFTARTLIDRSQLDSRSTVQQGEYTMHAYVRKDRLSAVAVSCNKYPRRVAHSLLVRLLMDFEIACPSSQWHTGDPSRILFERITQLLNEYQEPSQADNILKIQADLDETKIVLHTTMESLLQRGETLDDLVQRSSLLSLESKAFYTVAKKSNRCCSL